MFSVYYLRSASGALMLYFYDSTIGPSITAEGKRILEILMKDFPELPKQDTDSLYFIECGKDNG
jgi:hypothetical protein